MICSLPICLLFTSLIPLPLFGTSYDVTTSPLASYSLFSQQREGAKMLIWRGVFGRLKGWRYVRQTGVNGTLVPRSNCASL